jgi:hypothetical protein
VDFFDFYVFVFDVFSLLECFLYVWWQCLHMGYIWVIVI